MRLATVHHQGRDRVVAALPGGGLLDLAAAGPGPFATMLDLIEAGDTGLDAARTALAAAPAAAVLGANAVAFRAPLQPVQYRDCMVFEEHVVNAFAAAAAMTGKPFRVPEVWYQQPIYYKGNRLGFIGHGQDVVWPHYAEFLDIELELAIVIGRRGKDITPTAAPGHIFGYTILNDVSARDAQMREMPGQLGPAKGKDFDTGNVLGPYILTADEVDHPAALDMEARVSGERWGGGNSRQMHHDFAAILAHISAAETLYPGEVILAGTAFHHLSVLPDRCGSPPP